jgi:hypothetical protein
MIVKVSCAPVVGKDAATPLARQMVSELRPEETGLNSQPLTPRCTAESRYGIGVCAFGAWISAIVRSYDKEALRRNEASQQYAARNEKGTAAHGQWHPRTQAVVLVWIWLTPDPDDYATSYS